MTVAVTNHDNSVEAEPAPALHNLCYAVDVDQFFFEFQFACFKF